MIQREEKRTRLILKYSTKRENLKQALKNSPNYNAKTELYKKLESLCC